MPINGHLCGSQSFAIIILQWIYLPRNVTLHIWECLSVNQIPRSRRYEHFYSERYIKDYDYTIMSLQWPMLNSYTWEEFSWCKEPAIRLASLDLAEGLSRYKSLDLTMVNQKRICRTQRHLGAWGGAAKTGVRGMG